LVLYGGFTVAVVTAGLLVRTLRYFGWQTMLGMTADRKAVNASQQAISVIT